MIKKSIEIELPDKDGECVCASKKDEKCCPFLIVNNFGVDFLCIYPELIKGSLQKENKSIIMLISDEEENLIPHNKCPFKN